MRHVLIAGSSGFIGSHLSFTLSNAGHHVVGVDTQDFPVDLPPNYRHLNLDLLDRAEVVHQLGDYNFDGIFHMASSSDMVGSFSSRENYVAQEVSKHETLVQLARKLSTKTRYVFASSCSVYGNIAEGAASESHATDPQSPYALAKLEIENRLRFGFAGQHGSAVALRFFNVIGCSSELGLRESHVPETHLVPLLISAALSGKPFQVFGANYPTADGTAVRDFVDVRDICAGLLKAFAFSHSDGEKFRVWNLGSDKPTSVLDLVKALESKLQKQVELRFEANRIGDPARAVADISKAKSDLDWRPIYSLEDSLDAVLRSLPN